MLIKIPFSLFRYFLYHKTNLDAAIANQGPDTYATPVWWAKLN